VLLLSSKVFPEAETRHDGQAGEAGGMEARTKAGNTLKLAFARPRERLGLLLAHEKPEDQKVSCQQEWHDCREKVERSSQHPGLKAGMRPFVKGE
jgi:hypothetical protein